MPFKEKPKRDEENAKRKQRLAKIKRGPGVFVYDGSHYDTNWIPTVKMTGREVPVLDGSGFPVMDGSGRQVYQRAGTPVRDDKGRPVLGGEPKVERIRLETVKIWGVDFPEGVPVEVKDTSLALKLRCLTAFEEIEPKAEEPIEKPKRKPGRPAKPVEAIAQD